MRLGGWSCMTRVWASDSQPAYIIPGPDANAGACIGWSVDTYVVTLPSLACMRVSLTAPSILSSLDLVIPCKVTRVLPSCPVPPGRLCRLSGRRAPASPRTHSACVDATPRQPQSPRSKHCRRCSPARARGCNTPAGRRQGRRLTRAMTTGSGSRARTPWASTTWWR